MDKATLGGVLLGVGGIVAGLLLEGGNFSQILQPTAAMIVFGGTLGAVLIQYPLPVVLNAFRSLVYVFTEGKSSPQAAIQVLVQYANRARHEGIRVDGRPSPHVLAGAGPHVLVGPDEGDDGDHRDGGRRQPVLGP